MVLIDERDNKIIEALRRDCRASNAQIARDVGVSEGTIRRRLNRLMTDGTIEISVTERARQPAEEEDDAPALGVIIGMKVLPQHLNDALASMRALPEAKDRYVAIVSGEFNIIAWVEVEDIDALSRLLTDRVRKIEGVEKTETNVILDGGEGARNITLG